MQKVEVGIKYDSNKSSSWKIKLIVIFAIN